ncbi:Protein unc-13 D [Portunus trituberculatus]|uniref:Protein unc-13 D n=1 Tax=Portunus trituberculatus TaxID=210409 RepID=A0A5B7CNM1_PORTR|nr:Protein unc-13 D [Portunus trituberculatus]
MVTLGPVSQSLIPSPVITFPASPHRLSPTLPSTPTLSDSSELVDEAEPEQSSNEDTSSGDDEVLIPVAMTETEDLIERGADGWFMLEKNEERSKERGKIHLAGTVTSKAQLENKSRQSYDALLARLIHHQLTSTNNNNEQSEWSRPWDGHLSGPGAASLAQYAIMLDLSDAALHLAWWKVCSRIPTADAVWVLSRLQEVQAAISKNLYQDEELLELRSSFCSFIRDHTERLKNLHKTFPPSSGIIARRQLTFTLKALQCMQNHAGTRALLDLEGLPPLHEMVTSSLATHAKNW